MNRLITKIVLVLTILFAGCHDDVMEGVLPAGQPEQPQRALVTLQGIVGDGPITRTQIDGNRFSWLATDTIGVFYSAATDKRPVPFIVHQLSDDGASAVFVSIDSLDWVPDESGYVYAYYPWREDVVDQLPLTIDSIQEQTDAVASHTGRFDYMRADSVGYALPATTLHFRHLVALTDLVYRNTGAEDIRFDSLTITPSQADAWPVQGTTGMLPSDGGIQPTAQATVLKTVVKGDALTVAPGKSLPVRVVMLPADLSDLTMTIRVYTSAGDTVFTKPGLDFCAGKRYIMRLSSEEDDFDRLMTIYRETNGSKWTNNTNWGSDRPLSEWYGVSCDANGRVTQLWLNYNGLSGSLSAIMDKLTELTELTSISFEGNQLSGIIPSEIGKTTKLTFLNLWNNELSGPIPAELGQLTNLYTLQLGYNNLEGSLPKELGKLTKLSTLSVCYNRLTGEIPAEINALPNWSSISSGNFIPQQDGYGFSLADDPADRDALMEFYEATGGTNWKNNTNWGSDVSINLWYGIDCDANGKVTNLNLDNNGLSGEIPAVIGSLTNLTNLYLSNNKLSGTLPVELGQLKKLYQLSLYNNNLAGALPKELGQLTGLGHLNLNDNQFSGELPVELDSLTNLYSLQLRNNNLEGPLPKELGGLEKLNTLELSGNRFTGEIPAEIKALPNWLNFDKSYIVPQQDGYGFTLPENPDNRNALLAFYEATGGANWTKHTNWSTDKPINLWYGVTCDDNGNVTGLNLNDNGLSREIPANIGSLTNLTELNLGNNHLSGTIPVELGQLTKLRQLYLFNNRLEGTLPKEFGQMTELGYFDLSNNQLSGEIPVELGTMTNLYGISLYNNNLEGALPKELGKLTNLNNLSLSNNRLTGEIPAEIKALPNWSNFSSSVIPQQDGYGFTLPENSEDRNALLSFYEATGGANWKNRMNWCTDKPLNLWYGVTCDENGNVTQIDLGNNGLSGEIPTVIAELTHLTYIHLWNNHLSGTIPVELSQLTKLNYLSLSNNQLSGTIPVELCSLTNLSSLYLSYNNLEGALPKELCQLTNMNWLDLSYNRFTGEIPAGIKAFPNWSNFSSSVIPQQEGYGFTLADDAADRAALKGFYDAMGGANWTKKTNWGTDVSVNQWYGVTCDENGKVTQLRLSGNGLTGSIPTVIGELSHLKEIDLQNNNISGLLPYEISQLTKLGSLLLNGNNFSGTIPVEWKALTELYSLSLSGNNLEGGLPKEWSSLVRLGFLDLAYNRFSGEIPAEWGSLTNLYNLSLNNNNLEGTPPKEIGRLKNLSSLYLSGNRFTGVVPVELTTLQNWSNFNPSSNILPQQEGYGLTLP